MLGWSIPRNELYDNLGRYLDLVVSTGSNQIRTDFYWPQIMPTQNGPLDWSGIDPIVIDARRRNLDILGVLTEKPVWRNYTNNPIQQADLKHWARFVYETVLRNKNRITNWQVWNEPNYKRLSPGIYVPLLQIAHREIKRANPAARVIGPGLVGAPTTKYTDTGTIISVGEWLDRCYRAGWRGSYDALAIHPYTAPFDLTFKEGWTGWRQMIEVMRPLMEKNGDGRKPIWITEYGFPTQGKPEYSEAKQWNVARQIGAESRKYPWIERIYWYSIMDRGGDRTRGENWFGVYRPDGTPKPAIYPIRQTIRGEL